MHSYTWPIAVSFFSQSLLRVWVSVSLFLPPFKQRGGMRASLALRPPRRRQELASHRLASSSAASQGGGRSRRPPRPSVATRQPLRVCVCGSVNS